MTWLDDAYKLSQAKEDFVMISLINVSGHAPRKAGTKMLVSLSASYGTIGGGNLEQSSIDKARVLLQNKVRSPELLSLKLNPKSGDFGRQCCGGEVTILLEPIYPQRPSIAIFGAGHVASALLHILSLLAIDIYLIDSRPEQLKQGLGENSLARLHSLHAAIPEVILEQLPSDSHLLIMTHDHAEDIAILDQALRLEAFGFIGLIGSKVKWQHFQKELRKQGHSDDALKRVTSPIGLSTVPGKSPAAIAIATAAQLLQILAKTDAGFRLAN